MGGYGAAPLGYTNANGGGGTTEHAALLGGAGVRPGDPKRSPYEEAVRPPMPWNFFLIYIGSVMYFMSYSLEAATGSLTLLYFNFKGWGSNHRDYLYVAAMCSQAAMPIYAAPLLGYWAKKYRIKPLLVWCQVISLCGCALAAVANRRVLMLLALNMMAISGYSTQPLRTSYIARAVETRERTKWMSALAFSMLLGAAISPFITLACSQYPAPLPMMPAQEDSWLLWNVNRYTLVYIAGAVITAVVTAVTAGFFLEYPNDKAGGVGGKSAGDLAMSLAEERWRRLSEEERGYYRRVQAYFALLFTMDGISQGMMSVAIYPVLGDVYNLTADQMSLITMVLSTIALLPPAIAAVLSKWLADRDLMALGLALKSLGVMFTLFPAGGNTLLGRWLFIIGYVFVVKASLFFLMSGTSNLTKQLGDQANPQNMSYNVMSRNFGNFLGMLIAGPFILTWYHTWAWLVISFPLSLAWVLLLYPYFWQRMDPVDPLSPKWIPPTVWARLRVDDNPDVLDAELRAMRADERDSQEKKL